MKTLVFMLSVLLLFSCSTGIEDRVSIENNQIVNESNLISIGQHMNENIFWEIIEGSSEDEEMISKLITYEEDDIVKFEEILVTKLIESDHYNIVIAQKLVDGYVSDDTYLYFRAGLISLGKEIFEKTLINPDYLVDYFGENIEEIEFEISNEDLLYVSDIAYQRKTGKTDEDDFFPRNIVIEKGLDYDSFELKTKGEDFIDSDLPNRAPKLYKIFGSKDRGFLGASDEEMHEIMKDFISEDGEWDEEKMEKYINDTLGK